MFINGVQQQIEAFFWNQSLDYKIFAWKKKCFALIELLIMNFFCYPMWMKFGKVQVSKAQGWDC
jgi:hypothetical protein